MFYFWPRNLSKSELDQQREINVNQPTNVPTLKVNFSKLNGSLSAVKQMMQGIFHLRLNQTASSGGMGLMVKSLNMYHCDTGDPIRAW